MDEELPPIADLPIDIELEDDAEEGDADLEDATTIAGGDADLGAMLLALIDRRKGG